MRKRKNRAAWRVMGYSSLGLLGILAIAMLFPATSVVTEALENTWSAAQSKVAVRAVETVSMRLATKMDLELTPSSKGSFGIVQTELGVTTNDPEGFEIFMNTLDSEAALRGEADKIQTIEAETRGSEFSGNVWGYNLGKGVPTESSTYSRVPAQMTSVLKTASATVDAEEVYNLGFGVHITPSLPAGEYSNSIVVSVVANPATISSLMDLVYMQDMTSELCANTYPTETDLASMTDEEKRIY